MNSTRRSARGKASRMVRVEDKGAPHLARRAQRMVQRGVVVGAQVAAQPDEGAVQGLFTGP
jgi:hypothetical protein